jgi:hypothetical protein
MSKHEDDGYDRQRQALYLVSLLHNDPAEAMACLRLMSELVTLCDRDRKGGEPPSTRR